MTISVGILGGGQLAAMMIEAASKIDGVEISLLCENDDEATRFHPRRTIAALTERSKIEAWAESQAVITFEHEHVDIAAIRKFDLFAAKLRPSGECVEIAQDRELEKKTFEALEIPIAKWMPITASTSLQQSASLLPAILKTATQGYDGKGQFSINSIADIETALASNTTQTRFVLENRVQFSYEVSQVSVRTADGTIAHYPLVRNEHRSGILSSTTVIMEHTEISAQARLYTEALANRLGYVGTLAVEFFVVDGALLANEWAPRVHNSGHWSIEGAHTSQFENHLRAVAGLPLGKAEALGPATMWNLIGVPRSKAEQLIKQLRTEFPETATHLHWYDKSPRPARKVGHITVLEPRDSKINQQLAEQIPKLQILV